MKAKKQSKQNPIEEVINLIGNKWKILILRDLLDGAKRFTELKNSTKASQKSLTSNLRELENSGVLTRKVFPEVPPRVEYSLTDLGMTLAPIIDVMAEWGEDYIKYCRLKNLRQTKEE